MKKLKSLLLLALACLMACCCFMFTSCAMETTETYKFNAIRYTEGDNTLTVEVNGKFNGVEIKEDSFILVMNSNHSFALCSNLKQTDSNNNVLDSFEGVEVGTWTNGYNGAIYFTAHEKSGVLVGQKVDSNSIVLNIEDGLQIRFKK